VIDVMASLDLDMILGLDVDLLNMPSSEAQDYFFLRDVELAGSLALSATGLDASSTLGSVSISIDSGTVSGAVAAAITLMDPGTTGTTASGGRIDLRELIDGFSNPSTLIETLDITGSAAMTGLMLDRRQRDPERTSPSNKSTVT
jgi:hypothetical protein